MLTGAERQVAEPIYPVAVTLETDPARWVDALAGSHDRISELVGDLDAEGLRRQSYCDGWTIAQVLSHLGSGAEIWKSTLDAVVSGEPPPSPDEMPARWARWNAMSPEEQAENFLAVDGQLVETLENLGDQLDDLEFVLFGRMTVDATSFVAMRLSEHAMHTWDVAVALDPAATVDPDAVGLLVDRLPQTAERLAKATAISDGLPFSATIDTTDPQRSFVLSVDGGVRLAASNTAAPGGASGSRPTAPQLRLQLPAEALLRLVYGRLDPSHTPPSGEGDPATLGTLRQLFPGF
jgi:uncharacterized protein (TIGR03083 family)